MVGVPAVWESIRKGIVGKVAAGGTIRSSLFKGAMEAKRRNTPGLAKLADSVVLSSVRAATGGRLRIALNGGAAISRETQEFLSVALVPLLQGGFSALFFPFFLVISSSSFVYAKPLTPFPRHRLRHDRILQHVRYHAARGV
jgi:hypothetical protein